MFCGKITKNVKNFLIFFIIAAALTLSFIFILNATETSPPPSGECPYSLPPQGNIDGPLMRNDRTGEFINKIQNNEGGIIVGATITERVIKIAKIAAKCEVTLGSCGNMVKTIFWLAGAPGLSRITEGEDSGKIDGEPINSVRAISRDQQHNVCAINCGHADCSRPCTEESQSISASQKRTEVFNKLSNEIRERGQSEQWPELWTRLLRPGDGIVVYMVNSEPGGSHYAIFMGWEDETAGKAKIIQGAWGVLVGESYIYLKRTGGRRPLIRILRPE